MSERPLVYSYEWPDELGKGIDDVLKAHGPGAVRMEVLLLPEERAAAQKPSISPLKREGELLPFQPPRPLDESGGLTRRQLAWLEEEVGELEATGRAWDEAERIRAEAQKRAESVLHCGARRTDICRFGGEYQNVGRHTCKNPACTRCATRTEVNLKRGVMLPDLEGERHYASLAWLVNIDMPSADGLTDWEWDAGCEQALGGNIDRWGKLVSRLAGWKRWRGRILARSVHQSIDRASSMAELRLLVIDEGDIAELDAQVVQEFGEANVIPTDPVRWQSGRQAVAQVTRADSRCYLLGMGDPTDARLYAAWLRAKKRRHLFQSYAGLHEAAREAEKPEPLVCPCHHAPLKFGGWVDDRDGASGEVRSFRHVLRELRGRSRPPAASAALGVLA